MRWSELTPPESLDVDARVMAELRSRGRSAAYEKDYLHADGRRVTVLGAAAMLEGAGEECIAFNVDITNWKRAERDLAQAKEAAEASNRAKDRFLAVLSHELRNPLTPVLALAELYADDPEASEEQREDWATVARNVQWEAKLIEDLLDVTRIGRGKISFHRETLDLHALLSTLTAPDTEKNLSLDLKLDAPHHHVFGDPARLGQVFANLLNNAAKFSAEGVGLSCAPQPPAGGGCGWRSLTTASASTRPCCRRFSRRSSRARGRPTASTAAWASGWQLPRISSRRTAARSASKARGGGTGPPSRSI